jgi:hypothetical protein
MKRMKGKRERDEQKPVAEIKNCVGDVTHSTTLHMCDFES